MFEKEKMERAMELKEARKSELYRSDGARLFGDSEHGEREAAIAEEFAASMDSIEAGLDEKIASAEESLLILENADPTDVLSTSELESAGSRPVVPQSPHRNESARGRNPARVTVTSRRTAALDGRLLAAVRA